MSSRNDVAGPPVVLSARELSKTFDGQRALDRVFLELRVGEVHALLGQNGCGKSTLIKCLAGYHDPDGGAELEIDGESVAMPYSPARATALGLIFVHQDLGLIPSLSIAENFAAAYGYQTPWLGPIRWRALRARVAADLAELGHPDLHPDTIVSRLPISSQTIVAIARALSAAGGGARVLVLDEPTAALPESEAEQLFAAVRRVTQRGIAVLYVTHKLDELGTFVDRATILRDGRNVDTISIADVDRGSLVRMIVGRDVEVVDRPDRPIKVEVPILSVRDLCANRLNGVGFDLHPGEIVGVAGMLGSGRSELSRVLFGAQKRSSGTITFKGHRVSLGSPREAVGLGIALVPEHRRRDGGILEMSVSQNLTLTTVASFFHGLRISTARERGRVRELISGFDVRPTSPARKFRVLSGGNQQKVVIAKWLETRPEVVIFDEPVQGVDVGARAEIFALINATVERGAAVLLISSEIEQMITLSDRILVLRQGQLVADWPAQTLTPHKVTRAMYFDEEFDADEEIDEKVRA